MFILDFLLSPAGQQLTLLVVGAVGAWLVKKTKHADLIATVAEMAYLFVEGLVEKGALKPGEKERKFLDVVGGMFAAKAGRPPNEGEKKQLLLYARQRAAAEHGITLNTRR